MSDGATLVWFVSIACLTGVLSVGEPDLIDAMIHVLMKACV